MLPHKLCTQTSMHPSLLSGWRLALPPQDCWQGNPRLRPSFTEIIQRLAAMLQRWNASVAAAAAASSGGGGSGVAAGGAVGAARGSP